MNFKKDYQIANKKFFATFNGEKPMNIFEVFYLNPCLIPFDVVIVGRELQSERDYFRGLRDLLSEIVASGRITSETINKLKKFKCDRKFEYAGFK